MTRGVSFELFEIRPDRPLGFLRLCAIGHTRLRFVARDIAANAFELRTLISLDGRFAIVRQCSLMLVIGLMCLLSYESCIRSNLSRIPLYTAANPNRHYKSLSTWHRLLWWFATGRPPAGWR